MKGLLQNEVHQVAARVRWLREYFNLPPSKPEDFASRTPENLSLRLKAIKMMLKMFGHSQ